MPVGQHRNQLPAADGVTDNDVGQASDADAGDGQLQHGFRCIGGDIAADVHDPYAFFGVKRPAPQCGQAGDPQAVVALQVVRRLRRAATGQVARCSADDPLQVADAPGDHRRLVQRADADGEVDAFLHRCGRLVADGDVHADVGIPGEKAWCRQRQLMHAEGRAAV